MALWSVNHCFCVELLASLPIEHQCCVVPAQTLFFFFSGVCLGLGWLTTTETSGQGLKCLQCSCRKQTKVIWFFSPLFFSQSVTMQACKVFPHHISVDRFNALERVEDSHEKSFLFFFMLCQVWKKKKTTNPNSLTLSFLHVIHFYLASFLLYFILSPFETSRWNSMGPFCWGRRGWEVEF